MKSQIVISKATIDRLPLYFRTLRQIQEEGIEIISSEEMGRRIGVTPEQIRKDLASFGEFGKKGVGYYVKELIRNIGEILGLHRNWKIAIVGVGHLGWALANYENFGSLGFNLAAIFDVDSSKVGRTINNIEIQHLQHLHTTVQERHIQIGIITVPPQEAQKVADQLIEANIKGILNFSPAPVRAPDKIKIRNLFFTSALDNLIYYLTN